MAAIITRRRCTRQPPGSVEIDWSNPLTAGLAVAWYPNTSYELAGSYPATVGAADTFTSAGMVASGVLNSSNLSFNAGAAVVAAAAFSSYSIITPASLQSRAALWTAGPGTNGVTVMGVAVGYSDNTSIFAYAEKSYCDYVVQSGSGMFVIGQRSRVGATISSAGANFYRNGASWSSGSLNGSTSSSGSYLTIGGNADGTGLPSGGSAHFSSFAGTFELTLIWARALSAADHAQLDDNPWQIFSPRTRRLYFGVTSGTSFSGTPGLGALIKTGKIPALTIAYQFVPTHGSLVKTGQIPTLTRAFIFAPTAGNIVKTGEIPTLTRAFHFTPGQGSVVKTGQIPTLTTAFKLTPLTGSLLKTGYPMTLHAPMYPLAGSIVKTGEVPNLTISGGTTIGKTVHSWFVKAIGVKTKIGVNSQVDSDTGDTP